MNIAATALTYLLDASQGASSSAGPAAGLVTNLASTLIGGDGAGSNPVTGFASQLTGGLLSSLLGGGVSGSIAGILA